MKKLLISILLITSLTFSVLAQEPVRTLAEAKKANRTLVSFRLGQISLERRGHGYLIIAQTDNYFDKPFVIYIGFTKEEALKTIDAMIDFPSGTSAWFFVDCLNQDINMDMIGSTIYIRNKDFYGSATTTKRELQIMRSKIAKQK